MTSTSTASVAIAVHIYQNTLNAYEVFSLKRLVEVTHGKYPIRIVSPKGLQSPVDAILAGTDYAIEYFDRKYFMGLKGYNRLMMHPEFYKRFSKWEYVLIHHLDALVFKDALEDWCKKGYSNIGAPMFQTNVSGWIGEFIGTGNGGFCLRNIKDCLKVLNSFEIVYPAKDARNEMKHYSWKGILSKLPYFFLMITNTGNRSHYLLNAIDTNEDWFWGVLVPAKYKWFKVAEKKEAMAFSMEYNCEKLLEENSYQLPFGCHGWFKPTVKKFWQAQLLKAGVNEIPV